MFTKEEIESVSKQKVFVYSNNIDDIQFDLNTTRLGEFDNTIVPEYSTFVLENSGLLTLLITVSGGTLEYHKKIKNLSDLEYAITNIQDWEDDWNN